MQTLKSQLVKANLTESCLNFFDGQNKLQKLLTHAGANSINFVYTFRLINKHILKHEKSLTLENFADKCWTLHTEILLRLPYNI